MSDVAVLNPLDSESENSRFLAVLDPHRLPGQSDASFHALVRNLPGSVSIVSGQATPHLDDADAVELSNRHAVERTLADAHALVVVCPRFHTVREVAYLARLAVRSRIQGKVFVLVAASARPMKSRLARVLTRTTVRNADLTIVRDEASADVLLAAGVEGPLRIGADPAWSELGDLRAAPERSDRVVVAVDDDMDFGAVESMALALKSLVAAGAEVVLQAWPGSNGGTGERASAKLAAALGDNVTLVASPASLREARDFYATSRAIVATRFHALMAAASSGTPTLVVADGSTHRLAESLGVSSLAADASTDDITDELDRVLSNGHVAPAVVPSMIDRARASLDLVRFTLSEGAETQSTANEPLPLYPTPWRQ